MKKTLIIISVMLMGLYSALPSYCAAQAEKKDLKTLEGEIVIKDSAAQTIEVRWLRDPAEEGCDQTVFLVSEKARITNGIDDMGFEELNMGDRVIIDYYEDSFGELVAASITVKIE